MDRTNILLVDDRPDKLLALESVLADLGHNIVQAQSGNAALKHLLNDEFAVILLDVNMPGMDGFETAGLIRQSQRLEHTPIIFVSAISDTDTHVSRGYSLGAVDYILAPIMPEILRAKVEFFVELYQKTQQLKRQADERAEYVREQAARAAAEAAQKRSAFLAEAAAVLSATLDHSTMLANLSNLMTPYFADWCAVDLWDGKTLRRVASAGGSPDDCDQDDMLGVQANSTVATSDVPSSEAAEVVRTGRARIVLEVPEPIQVGTAEPAASTSPQDNCVRSYLCLPLSAREQILGAITFVLSDSDRYYSADDVALGSDIASRAAMAVDNARMYLEAQRSDRRKDEFLAMLGHELRNPLAAINNALQLMDGSGAKPADTQQNVQVLRRQVEHMSRLVDDLLDVARITHGAIELREQVVSVAPIVSQAVEMTRWMIESRGHTLHLANSTRPLSVKADPARLEQIITNLLTNAAKYTPSGGNIWVSVNQEDAEVVLSVRDDGAGIGSEMLPRLFEMFAQEERSRDSSQGGLGIGLSLVRKLVEMHRGAISARSEGIGMGSEFIVRLPLFQSPNVDRPAGPTGLGAKSISRRVLLVDDNPDIATTMAALLRKCGHEVKVAHDGPMALEAARLSPPEVIILDIGLPGMDGYEVAQRLRDQEGSNHPLLIALTGYGEDSSRSEHAQFDRHLVKPVSIHTLQQILA